MFVHPHKRQLKVHFENPARAEVNSGPSPYLYKDPVENDNRIWQLKSRSGGGKKTSASSKIRSILTQRLQRASVPPLRAVHRHWLSADYSTFKASIPGLWDVLIPDETCDRFRGRKKQQTMPDFLQQLNQHVRLPVQTTQRSNFKMSSKAHA